jgi:hypothetical protein
MVPYHQPGLSYRGKTIEKLHFDMWGWETLQVTGCKLIVIPTKYGHSQCGFPVMFVALSTS